MRLLCGFPCIHPSCLGKVPIYGNVVWYARHVSETHRRDTTHQVGKNSMAITQFQTSMMVSGRFGQQISGNHAFDLTTTRVEIGQTVYKTPNHYRPLAKSGGSNDIANGLQHQSQTCLWHFASTQFRSVAVQQCQAHLFEGHTG